jgi:subtilase family serine protease
MSPAGGGPGVGARPASSGSIGTSDAAVHSCAGAPKPGRVTCDAILNHSARYTRAAYTPADLQSAYLLASAARHRGRGQTVAVVDAYDDPHAAMDLARYRRHYRLPPCTTASGCFTKVGQSGHRATLPRPSGAWAQEESVDLDMVTAICPHCRLLLVEARSATVADLGASVNTAVRLGATVISTSYGAPVSSADTALDTAYYRHPGVVITASAGDSGYGVEYPAASRDVTAVGGTVLKPAGNHRGWTETAWSGSGSGCSIDDARPSWQASDPKSAAICTHREIADVSAVADPDTGVSGYDSYSYRGVSGWLDYGGTSVSSAIVAAVYALAGNAATVTYGRFPYRHRVALNRVTSGSNGHCGTMLCVAGIGWDGPTGLGTPAGFRAF